MNPSLRVRLFVVHLVALAAALALTAVLAARQDRAWLIDRGSEQLERVARLAVSALGGGSHDWPARADALARELGVRVTLIARDGHVVGDSEVSRERLGQLENHATRPEVAAALAGRAGHHVRR